MMNSMPSALTDSNSERQKELLLYFRNLEQQNDGWKLAINELTNNRFNLDESAIFFYYKIIEHYIKTGRYEQDSEENRFLVKQYLYNYFASKKYDNQTFLLNKYAVIVNSVFMLEYPLGKWSSFFQDFLSQCNESKSSSLFLRILDQLNTEIGEREYMVTLKEIEKSTLIKDLMRENAVASIVQFWFNLVHTYIDSEPRIVSYSLSIMGKYVSWIDINFLTGDTRMTNVLNLLYNDQTRIGVLDLLFGILHKGMDPIAKATFIEQFCHLQCVNDLFTKEYDNCDLDFSVRLAKFFNKIGIELIGSFKKLKSVKCIDQNQALQLKSLFTAIDHKFMTLCKFLSKNEVEISIEVHSFAREYLQLIKQSIKQPNDSFGALYEVNEIKVQEIILTISKILIQKCKYPLDFEFAIDDPLIDGDDESDFENYRKSCSILFENLSGLHKDFFSQFICTTIVEPVLGGEISTKLEFNELEIALYFLKCIGHYLETNDNKKFCELLKNLIKNSLNDYPHIAITISYFELISKYDKQFSSSGSLSELMPQVLISFLDKNGLKSPSLRLRCKVTQLFNRFVKSNIQDKTSNEKLLSFSEEIIKTLTPLIKLDYYLSFKGKSFNEFNVDEQQIKANRENHLLLYETISYLIMRNRSIENDKKLILLNQIFLDEILDNTNKVSSLLQTMLSSVTSAKNGALDKQIQMICEDIAHLINLTVYSHKAAVNGETAKDLQAVYLVLFNHFVKLINLQLNEDCLNILQRSMSHFLYRLVACSDEDQILPLLPTLISNVFLPKSFFTMSTIQEIEPLLEHLINKFNHSWMFIQHLLPFLNELFLPFVSYIFTLTNSAELEDKEKANLQKIYFSFIWSIANNLPEVLKNLESQVFVQILITLNQGLDMSDVTIQKNCLNIFKRMIENHEKLGSTLSSELFKCVYATAIPTTLTLMIKINEQNQIILEVIAFLTAVHDVRGLGEFCEFLNQFFTQKFPLFIEKLKPLCDAFSSKDTKSLKILFKEFKKLHQAKINTV